MLNINYTSRRLLTGIAIVAIFVCTQVLSANSTLVYQEDASEIIMNSLKSKKKHNYLKKLYGQVFFMPVWMHKEGLSPAGKELLAHIKNDSR